MRKILHCIEFLQRHRKHLQDFTRVRKLSFGRMILLGLTRSVESLQSRLNEAQMVLRRLAGGFDGGSVSASAYSQARSKLKHTAFIEINRDILLPTFYAPCTEAGDIEAQYWRGFRLVGIDGSDMALPTNPDLLATFGGRSFKIANRHIPGEYITGKHPTALAVVCYDLLNNLALDACLMPCGSNEITIALSMIPNTAANDLIITDRGFASYQYMATCIHHARQFLTRAPRSMYTDLQARARANPNKSANASIPMPYHNRKIMRSEGLPESITIRCQIVVLPTGEEEILFTSLLDEHDYPSEDYTVLYNKRWHEETYFDRVKNVMNIELFSGLSEESIRQDFWATLLISNIETLFTADAQEILDAKSADNLHEQQVNHVVAFSALRSNAMELLFSTNKDVDELLAQLTILFLQTPVPKRPQRHYSHKKPTPAQQVRYHKYTRKPAS
jgi:hypothetical protein